jgi:hypothetical protein
MGRGLGGGGPGRRAFARNAAQENALSVLFPAGLKLRLKKAAPAGLLSHCFHPRADAAPNA